MEYDAITIDTQVIEQNGFRFDKGYLAQLKQFSEGKIKFLITIIVIQETIQRLTDKIRKLKDEHDLSRKKALEYGIINDNDDYSEEGFDAREFSKRVILKFLVETKPEIIRADDVSANELIKMYFTSTPPFSLSGNKKSEFPDAISLLSLEKWAEKNDAKILAVSGDKDWAEYAKGSKKISVKSHLKDALATIQKHEEEARILISKFFKSSNIYSDFMKEFEYQLSNNIEECLIYPEIESEYSVDAENIYIKFKNFHFLENENSLPEFQIIRSGYNKIVVEIPLIVSIRAETTASFSFTDSEDDEIVIGTARMSKEDDINVVILATITGLKEDDPILDEIEIVDHPTEIDFGYGKPDDELEEYFEPEDFGFPDETEREK